jgi:hypothetical protein
VQALHEKKGNERKKGHIEARQTRGLNKTIIDESHQKEKDNESHQKKRKKSRINIWREPPTKEKLVKKLETKITGKKKNKSLTRTTQHRW